MSLLSKDIFCLYLYIKQKQKNYVKSCKHNVPKFTSSLKPVSEVQGPVIAPECYVNYVGATSFMTSMSYKFNTGI